MKFSVRHFHILVILLSMVCFFVSCHKDNGADLLLQRAEILVSAKSDSALLLLQSVENTDQWSKEQRAYYNLLLVQSKSSSPLDISGDSTIIQESVDYFVRNHDVEKAARAYYYQNRVYQRNNNLDAAARSNLKAIEYIRQSGENEQLAGFIYLDMGKLYQQQGNYEEAMKNFRWVQQYFVKINDEEHASYTHRYIGTVYLYMKPQQADSAIMSYHRALDYALSIRDSFEMAVLYKNISLAYGEKKDAVNEKAYMLKALDYSKDDDIMAIVQRMLAEIYANANCPDSAVYYMNRLMNNPTGNTDVDDRYYNQILLYRMYKMLGDCSLALDHYEKSRTLADSIHRYKVDQSVLEIQQKYDKEALENRYARVLVQRLTLIASIIVILLLTAMIVFLFISKMRNRKIELLEARESLRMMNQMLNSHRERQQELASSLEEKEKMLTVQQKQQETLASTLEENRERLKSFLMEKLNIAQKIAQLNIVSTDNDDVFMSRYQKVFGKNLMDELGWENLSTLINELYDGFADNLKAKYPGLGEKDLQLCCFIRVGFRPEEMAVLLNYTTNTVRVKKSRLGQKMGFVDYDAFLSALMDI